MLELRQLTKTYRGPVHALRQVDLEIPTGMFGLLGPNGAGKTSLMRILAGLLEPTSGTVLFDGDDIVARPERVWARLGYLPQSFGFYPHLSGRDMLAYLLRLKGAAGGTGQRLDDLVEELLARVNLTAAAGQKVSTYSGGMRQRLGIAQVIACDPALVIVDEPTAGLDPEERLRFYRLLSELAADRTVLLSTHIVEDVAVLCPRFAVLRQGRLVTVTTPQACRRSLAGTIFEGAVASGGLDALHAERQVTQALLVAGRNRVRIHQPDGAPPAGFEAAVPTLEDAYMVLMRRSEETGEPIAEQIAEQIAEEEANRPRLEVVPAAAPAAAGGAS